MSQTIRTAHPVRLVAAATAVVAATLTAPTFSTPAYAGIGQPIKRITVRNRALNWAHRDVPYSQSGTALDPDGRHAYRRDCSGLVSMAWHTRAHGLGALTTATIPRYANRIAKKNLRRGDVLDWPSRHVVLFGTWANRAHTEFWLFEESTPGQNMNHRRDYLSSYTNYIAYRYVRIVDR